MEACLTRCVCTVGVLGLLFWNAALGRGVRLVSSPVLFNIYHAAVMLDFRAHRKEFASAGLMDEGVEWIAQVDGDLFGSRTLRKRGRSQLRTVLGDVEFADGTVTCSAASSVSHTGC